MTSSSSQKSVGSSIIDANQGPIKKLKLLERVVNLLLSIVTSTTDMT